MNPSTNIPIHLGTRREAVDLASIEELEAAGKKRAKEAEVQRQ